MQVLNYTKNKNIEHFYGKIHIKFLIQRETKKLGANEMNEWIDRFGG